MPVKRPYWSGGLLESPGINGTPKRPATHRLRRLQESVRGVLSHHRRVCDSHSRKRFNACQSGFPTEDQASKNGDTILGYLYLCRGILYWESYETFNG